MENRKIRVRRVMEAGIPYIEVPEKPRFTDQKSIFRFIPQLAGVSLANSIRFTWTTFVICFGQDIPTVITQPKMPLVIHRAPLGNT
ncbi:MAG: hypothetical protein IPL12_08375 [Bacteroidetes bacterium]|nr:hypothetical protein [Bacteroidota bacterium]